MPCTFVLSCVLLDACSYRVQAELPRLDHLALLISSGQPDNACSVLLDGECLQ